MLKTRKLGIIVDEDFAQKNVPPYPKPSFLSYENPYRLQAIYDYLLKEKIFEKTNVARLEVKVLSDEILELVHTKYHINSIRQLSQFEGVLSEEVYLTEDTFELAKKAVGGAVQAVLSVIEHRVSQAIALIRPPGHHALRERASGLCIFNNIAIAIQYLRTQLSYTQNIAIIDIDNHFGDGLAQFFYEDPRVLYFSIHEYDFLDSDLGFLNEIGEGAGTGSNINFPVPSGLTHEEFLELRDILEPILSDFEPDLIVVAMGFDMYFDDPIGNCLLTANTYYDFTKWLLEVSKKLCRGKLAFILEGGYSLCGLPFCVGAVIKGLLNELFEKPKHEVLNVPVNSSDLQEIRKIKNTLLEKIKEFYPSLRSKNEEK